jgi:DDE family transposase
MAHRTKAELAGHVRSEIRRLEAQEGLPFRELVDGKRFAAALKSANVLFRERTYTPIVTLCAFLSQVTAGKDPSCQNAVSRVLVDRVERKQKPCSSDSSSFCTARARLPEKLISGLSQETGQELHSKSPVDWLWNGRPVIILDGSTGTMDDTPENQKEYPQSRSQKAGLGFPILRYVILISLAAGAVLDCAISSCRGKLTGEQSLFRTIWSVFRPGDIVLGDCLYDCYRDIALLLAGGVDSVFGKKQSRKCDFRNGRRLGKDDHIVRWIKPAYQKSRYASKAEWESLPDEMEMREVRLTVHRKGYLTRTIMIVTTLLDAEQYSAEDLTDLFAERWHCELDLRSIKQALGMYHFRCRTPEMVRKELWMHLLAYNLIRVRMAQAALQHDTLPRRLSFTAAKNHIHNFTPLLNRTSGEERDRIERELLKAIATSDVGKRNGRKEPRAVKKRKQKYPLLTEPRAQARQRLAA